VDSRLRGNDGLGGGYAQLYRHSRESGSPGGRMFCGGARAISDKKTPPVKGGVLRLGREMLMGQIAVARLASI